MERTWQPSITELHQAPATAARETVIECKRHRLPGALPVLALVLFAGLGLFLAWLLDSSSRLVGQTPDRSTQFLMVSMCVMPAGALLAFRWLSATKREAAPAKENPASSPATQ